MTDITLVPLAPDDREQFIRDNQEAFNYGALEEFGRRDDHFEEDGEIISRETIEQSIDGGEAYRIMQAGRPVGGVVIRVDGDRGDLELLFVSSRVHSKGIGYAAWCAVERLHPEVTVWETVTPYFEKRNIHFYVNRCGFHIVEFYNSHHPDPNDPDAGDERNAGNGPDAGDRPGAGSKPNAGDRPGAGSKPNAGDRPGAGSKPNAGNRPGAGNLPDEQFQDGMFRFEKRMS